MIHGVPLRGLRSPRLLAFLLGAFCVLGFAPFDSHIAVSPAPTFSLAGLFLLWRGQTPHEAAWRGLAWGAGCFLTGVSWVYVSLAQFSGMAPPLAAAATVLFCLYLALFPALAGLLFARWQSRTGRDIALFAGLWALTEWLRGTFLTGFPWLAVGYSQTPPSPLAGFAPVLGVYGLGLLVALTGALLAWLWLNGWRQRRLWLALCLILGGGMLLRYMPWTTPIGEPLGISLLQGNIAQSVKWDPERMWLSIDRYLDLVKRHPAPLVVLPETALPLFFSEVPREILKELVHQGDAIIGVAVTTDEGGYTNGAVALSPTLETQAYAKRHLVPFGEYPPPGFAWFFRFARIPMSGFTPGSPLQAPLKIGEQKIAPNICYEDLFGEELLPGLADATLLLNLSNTAWFGDSLAQPQHLQIARMRAMETGRVMLRATNTGMTAMILPDGRVAGALPAFTTGALIVEAQGYQGLTPYAQWGNAMALLLAVLVCVPAWRAARGKARETQTL
jgi:apolipoprotein N-acyltransferase